MDRRFHTKPFVDAEPISENGPDSPSSGDDMVKTTTTFEPSPKKSKRGVQKRVVSVPIGDVEGSKSKGEAYPPSDSWAWRKYGQKPIKGSPYPRGYYRCSSSKGCPARKQVERSRVDPTRLIITYACDHNHPIPTKSHSSTTTAAAAATAAASAATAATSANSGADGVQDNEIAVFSGQTDLDLSDGSEVLLSGCGYHRHHQWFDDDDVVSTAVVLESPLFEGGGGGYAVGDVSMAVSGEDESLFADLGELPECSVVFRRRIVEPDEQNRRCSLSAVPCCGSTG
ncbi:WRKY domain containing protein [Trema orientale]|uniref:WRKY domain containing protein n=1 Tax=Trema orientale TaxID=63057 RepID=A0A2P5FFB7_TREOI|nr:WRKY domain containing protein [Trema orientale]